MHQIARAHAGFVAHMRECVHVRMSTLVQHADRIGVRARTCADWSCAHEFVHMHAAGTHMQLQAAMCAHSVQLARMCTRSFQHADFTECTSAQPCEGQAVQQTAFCVFLWSSRNFLPGR